MVVLVGHLWKWSSGRGAAHPCDHGPWQKASWERRALCWLKISESFTFVTEKSVWWFVLGVHSVSWQPFILLDQEAATGKNQAITYFKVQWPNATSQVTTPKGTMAPRHHHPGNKPVRTYQTRIVRGCPLAPNHQDHFMMSNSFGEVSAI